MAIDLPDLVPPRGNLTEEEMARVVAKLYKSLEAAEAVAAEYRLRACEVDDYEGEAYWTEVRYMLWRFT